MPVELILFDLDDTLMRTADLEAFRGTRFLNEQPQEYVTSLQAQVARNPFRSIYSEEQLLGLRRRFPGVRLGVFTRSPRHYAQILLRSAYPNIQWDTLVAFESVTRTKPSGEGVLLAMNNTGVGDVQNVWLVGDGKTDVLAAYDAGCCCVLDQSSWPNPRRNDDWEALKRLPDANIRSSNELEGALVSPSDFLPVAERLEALDGRDANEVPFRFEKSGYFNQLVDRGGPIQIHSLGRHFSRDAVNRAEWHAVTNDIHRMKDSLEVPEYWIQAIRKFIKIVVLSQFPLVAFGRGSIVVTVVPAKQGRVRRLEAMLDLLAESHNECAISRGNIEFLTDALEYGLGALSHHGNGGLNREQRFINARDNLRAVADSGVEGKHVVVIDDVVTSGASLIYADNCLRAAGASGVTLLALTKNVGNR